MTTTKEPNRYLTANEVRARFGNISDMTLWRWLRDDRLSFPRPLVINHRRLFREDEIEAWADAMRERAA